MATPYTKCFYAENQVTSGQSAAEIVPWLVDVLKPKSAVDVGCGVATWLGVLAEHGVKEVLGIDGDYVDREQLRILPDLTLTAIYPI